MGAKSIAACDDMIASSGFGPRSGQTKDPKIRLVFVTSPLSM